MWESSQKASPVERLRAVWKRRKWSAISLFVGALSAVAGIAAGLPDVYQAKATLLIEPPRGLAEPAPGEIEARLHLIGQEILSRSRLRELVTRLDLYPDLRKTASEEAVLDRMRRDVKIAPKVSGPSWAAPVGTTTAFTVSYRSLDRSKVAAVANAVASIFVEEDLERQTGTVGVLAAQLDDVRKRVVEQERRLGGFQERHGSELPGQSMVNLASLQGLQSEARLVRETRARALERRASLAEELTKAIAAGAVGPEGKATQLAKLREDLAVLRRSYTDAYPDIRRLKVEIATLEAAPSEAGSRAESSSPPAVVQLQEALREVDGQIEALAREESSLRQEAATYEQRLSRAPRHEQAYEELARDYETTKTLYATLLKRYEEARLAEDPGRLGKGGRFRILESAVDPADPAAPSRPALAAAGLLLAVGLAVGATVVGEQTDASFHSVDDVRGFTRVPVLSSIPSTGSPRIRARRRWRRALAAAVVVLAFVLIAKGSYRVAQAGEQVVFALAGRSS